MLSIQLYPVVGNPEVEGPPLRSDGAGGGTPGAGEAGDAAAAVDAGAMAVARANVLLDLRAGPPSRVSVYEECRLLRIRGGLSGVLLSGGAVAEGLAAGCESRAEGAGAHLCSRRR
jgi:hypothetical protein